MFEYIICINSIIVQYICACVVTSLSVFKSEVMRIRWPVCCYIANWEDQYFENDFILQCIWASWDINYLKKKYSSFDLETTMSFMVRCTRYNIMWKSLSVICDSNKTDLHHITEMLLKVALNTIKQTKPNLQLISF